MCFISPTMLVAVITQIQLKELVHAAIRKEGTSHSNDKNIKRWRTRFVRGDRHCVEFLEQFVVDLDDMELLAAKQDHDKVVITVKPTPAQIEAQQRRNAQKYLFSNSLLYSLAIIYVGTTFAQVHALDMIRGISQTPSESTYYRNVKTISEAISECVEASLERARARITSDRYVSYDTAWRHRRRCRQASGVLVDLLTGKVIDYYIAVIKMPAELIPQTDKWAQQTPRVDYNEGYPQGLEVKIFHRMAKTVLDNDFIKGLVKDNEHDPGGEIKKAAKGKKIFVDVNHNIKHFRNYMSKLLKESGLEKFYNTLFYSGQYLLMTRMLTEDEKHEQWRNIVNHIQGDHSRCMHDDPSRTYHSWNLTEKEKSTLQRIVRSCDKFIDLSRPGLNTQHNESLHSTMALLASKQLSWKSTIPARLGIAILKKNEGENALLQICSKLGIDCPKVVYDYIELKAAQRNQQHARDHDRENMNLRNQHRTAVNKALSKPKQKPLTSRSSEGKSTGSKITATQVHPESACACQLLSSDESEGVFFDDSSESQEDIFDLIVDEDEYDDSESDSSFMVDATADALDDAAFQRALDSGLFDETGRDVGTPVPSFTGIVNNYQTCYISVILQAIAMVMRNNNGHEFLPDGRFAKSLHEYLMNLSSSRVTELRNDGILRKIISYHNDNSAEKLKFGTQNDPVALLPSILPLVNSWWRDTNRNLFQFRFSRCQERRSCSCGAELPDVARLWDLVAAVDEKHFYHLANSQGNCDVTSVQQMFESEFSSIYTFPDCPEHSCPECGLITHSSKTQVILESAPFVFVTSWDRRFYDDQFDPQNPRYHVSEKRISFTDGLVIPVYHAGELVFANYDPLSIICHVGQDQNGHCVVYNFSDGQVAMISDTVVRWAHEDDIAVMENRSLIIFWSFSGYTYDPEENESSNTIEQTLERIRAGTNGTEATQCSFWETDMIEDHCRNHGQPSHSPSWTGLTSGKADEFCPDGWNTSTG